MLATLLGRPGRIGSLAKPFAAIAAVFLGAVVFAACATGANNEEVDARAGTTDAAITDAAIIDAQLADACVPQAELCNSLSDDCDADIDEDFPTLGNECNVGVGLCSRTGVLVCAAGGEGVECSVVAGAPVAELCDGEDNNCDGMIDEGFNLGAMCDGPDLDMCAEGMIMCAPSGVTMCSDTTSDNLEVCDGVDNDCDGLMDEGFNLGAMCDGTDGDSCTEGVFVCASNGTAVCNDSSTTTTELCNGLDDDCRDGIDNGYNVGTSCSVGVGACMRTGSYVCTTAGTGTQCNAVAGTAVTEICGDGIDQDCNGSDVSCPVNDYPAGAIDISSGGTFTVDLSAAHDDNYISGSGCGYTGGRDVFYKFTLPAAEVVYVDTLGSDFDSALRIFPGSCAAPPATASACFDDSCSTLQSQGATQLAAGSYCLVVDQYAGFSSGGAAVITFTRGGRTGTALPAGTSVTGNSCTGVSAANSTSCQPNATSNDIGYYFLACPAVTKTVSASTCTGTTFDSIVSLTKAGGASIACSDDGGCGLQSSFTGAVVNTKGLYWLNVDGYSGFDGSYNNCGPFTLTYSGI